jgi:hypothetical protein
MSEAAGSNHHREFSRVRVGVSALVHAKGNTIRSTAVRDISMKGAMLATAERLPVGKGCRISILLGPDGPSIEAHGRVIRHADDGFAVEFLELYGLESLEHLRNLVLCNANDPDLVQHEFDTHLGIKAAVDPAEPPEA